MSGPLFDWPFGELSPQSFDLIVADPPWAFENFSEAGEGKNAKAHYQCMSLADISALPVMDLASENCLLWLWATNPMIPQALDVMAAWGFTFKTSGVWHKKTVHGKTAFGTGYIFRSASEPILIGTRGEPKTTRSTRSVIEAPVREHSRKPDEAFSVAESLMPNARRLELFSRQSRDGWQTWGDQSAKFDEVAA
ncbi:MT-A70 family methyltransferase [Ahrensia sp. R2A130]|uniref:MT-A70 family methyltransferase n=1 Tax=Ahrensia sp. R2A130 TaxID=744979 RepID=UPI0001E0BCB1|nr:MT-A70 family methyltransferase [Ahrensia sp. R2A130]EFL88313.1 MT-A70 family protein [Ahrensia sp. R2A130]